MATDRNPISHIVPPKTVTSAPRCLGCGFTVEKQGDVCAACAEKPQFQGKHVAPEATRNLTPQAEPAYLRPDYQGNFKRPAPRIDEET